MIKENEMKEIAMLVLFTVTLLAGMIDLASAQSTQEINRQQHQMEVMRQQQLILQQQFIQQQQLEQMRRDAEFRHNQSNRNLDPSYLHLHQPRY